MNDVITAFEAAAMLQIHQPDVYRLINEGKLKARKSGKTWLIDKESVTNRIEALKVVRGENV
jgi:excisionase family DNA binding protein